MADVQRQLDELDQKITALRFVVHLLADMAPARTRWVVCETLRLMLSRGELDRKPVPKGMLVQFYGALLQDLDAPRSKRQAKGKGDSAEAVAAGARKAKRGSKPARL